MSLLPIIYTSLLIFTVVMIVVLLISYLSYKAKQRNAVPDNSMYEDTIDQSGSIFVHHPAFTPAVQPIPVAVPVYSQPARTVYTEQRRNSSTMYTTERQEQRRVTKDTSSRKRFQVVNNNSRSEFLQNLQPTSLGGYNRAPVPEFNFLNYYSDQQDDTLNSISVERYKSYR